MQDRESPFFEYRLSWEMPADHWLVAGIEQQHGKNVWPRWDWDTLGEWRRTEVVFRGDERLDQYNQLRRWAETREQPIRNVRLERRKAPDPNEGWQRADG